MPQPHVDERIRRRKRIACRKARPHPARTVCKPQRQYADHRTDEVLHHGDGHGEADVVDDEEMRIRHHQEAHERHCQRQRADRRHRLRQERGGGAADAVERRDHWREHEEDRAADDAFRCRHERRVPRQLA